MTDDNHQEFDGELAHNGPSSESPLQVLTEDQLGKFGFLGESLARQGWDRPDPMPWEEPPGEGMAMMPVRLIETIPAGTILGLIVVIGPSERRGDRQGRGITPIALIPAADLTETTVPLDFNGEVADDIQKGSDIEVAETWGKFPDDLDAELRKLLDESEIEFYTEEDDDE